MEAGGKLRIFNSAGVIQAELSSDEEGGVLGICNPAGKAQAEMHVSETGGQLGIYNPAGEAQAWLGAEETGGAMYVLNKIGERVAGFSTDDDGSGSAYIFKRSGTSWSQQDKLTASDAAAGDFFGLSVSISGDYAIVGAAGDDDDGTLSGSAYVFKRSGTSWSQQDKLTASDAVTNDYFGFSVSISGDNAIMGAWGNDDDGGSAYIFTRSGTSWSQQTKLTASDAVTNDYFGSSVSISGDNAIVGAWGNDDDGSNSGSAYVYADVSPEVKLVFKDDFGMRGEQLRVPIFLENNNSVPLKGLQFDVALPDSMLTFVGVVDSLGDQGFSVSAQLNPDRIIVVVFTLSEGILLESTEIGALVYDVKPVLSNLIRGEFIPIIQVSPHNTEVVDTLTNQVITHTVTGNYTIGIRGDANDDGSVSIIDVVMSVLAILGKELPPAPVQDTYAYALMDANGDEAINVVDAVYQVSRILGRPIDQPLPKVVYSPVTVDLNQPMASGTALYLPVTIETDTPIGGLQLSYAYDPSLVTIGEPRMGGPFR